MDYGKFKYEKSKKDKKAKSAANELKMVRLHPRTGPHDRDILVRHSERFLREGHKVRVVCQFKGRENAYPELGKSQLDAIANALAEIANVEGTVTKVGRDMTMMLSPKPGVKPLPKVSKGSDKGKGKLEELDEEDAAFEAAQAELAAEADEESEAAVAALDENLDGDISEEDETEDETDESVENASAA
jgi:translation initiation factor IF-3